MALGRHTWSQSINTRGRKYSASFPVSFISYYNGVAGTSVQVGIKSVNIVGV
jgi:hypothetical protein